MPDSTKQTVPAVEGVALSFMSSFPTFKTPRQKSLHLPPIEVRKSVVMDIYGDALDTGMDSTVDKSECWVHGSFGPVRDGHIMYLVHC